jgi:low affinity Fe/Cu permease
MVWPVMIPALVLSIVYLVLVSLFLGDIKEYKPASQMIIILAVSIIYLAGCFIYFSLKFPTLF